MFKKTAIAALVLGFTGAASAAMYAPAPAPSCAAGNVTVPCEKSAWDLGVDALYLRSEDNVLVNTDGHRADYGFGFRLEGSYHFGTGNDVTVNWSHVKKSSNKTLNTVAYTFKNTLDIVNLELAQVVNFGESVSMRFNGGVQYLANKDDSTVATVVGNRKTTGFGPRVGMMSKYDFGNGFGVYGDFSAALLVAKYTTTATTSTDFYATALSTDANIGVAYTHSMAQGDLTARLAWGVKQVSMNAANHGWDGFTLGMKWVGNA